MPRGGRREGAGRKKEYTEPVRKILLGLPESLLKQLDDYAKQHELSRPKAVALLLKQVESLQAPQTESLALQPKKKIKKKRKAAMLDELKSLIQLSQ